MVLVNSAVFKMASAEPVVRLETPEERARFLITLKAHMQKFSPDEHAAYNALRDEMMRFARGEGSMDAVLRYTQPFLHYIGSTAPSVSSSPAATKISENAVTEVPVATPKEEVMVKVIPEKQKEVQTKEVSKTFISGRRGPDVRVPEIATVSAPAPQEHTSSVVEKVEQPSVRLDSVPEKKEEETQESTKEYSLSELQQRVHDINESLNIFANGKAFQWLSDPNTGYREYMSALISLREDVHKITTLSAADSALLARRVEELARLADGVRAVVGDGQKKSEKEPASNNTSVSAVGQAEENHIDTSAVDTEPQSVGVSGETQIVPQEEQQEKKEPEDSMSNTAPEVIRLPVEEAPVSPREEISAAYTSSLQNSEVSASSAPAEEPLLPPLKEKTARTFENKAGDILSQAGADTVVKEESLAPSSLTPPVSQTAEVPAFATPAISQNPVQDSLYTPVIATGLHNLLTKWLGTTGFLGFGSSGEEHPDWVRMRELYVEDIQADDGVIPKGIRPETLANIRANIKAWSDKYGLAVEGPGETMEHFMRRVVRASIAP